MQAHFLFLFSIWHYMQRRTHMKTHAKENLYENSCKWLTVRFRRVVSGIACQFKTTISDYNPMGRHKDSSECNWKPQSWTHVNSNASRQLSQPKWIHLEARYKYNTPYILSSPIFPFFWGCHIFFIEILQSLGEIRSVIIHHFEYHIKMQLSRIWLNSHHVYICQYTRLYSVGV